MKPTVLHKVISASAGSGKTYQLANRYLGLLLRGAAPEKIIALTFTRKAAGEIFERIIRRLAEAAIDDNKRIELQKSLADEPMLADAHTDQVSLLKALRTLSDKLPQLAIGTLDSFFFRIASAFPFELGLNGALQIVAEENQEQIRRDVLKSVLIEAEDQAKRDFLESFKLSTFGKEEKRVFELLLNDFIKKHHRHFISAPDGRLWGNPAQIWPTAAWWNGQTGTESPALEKFMAAARSEKDQRWAKSWMAFFDELSAWDVGQPLSNMAQTRLSRLFEQLEAMEKGSCEIKHHKDYTLSPSSCDLLLRFLRGPMQKVLGVYAQRTAGLFRVLDAYERTYHLQARSAGKLSFSDIIHLLAPAGGDVPGFTGDPQNENRLFLNYRLDGQFDHWMLDEFQDTSREQWRVLENLVDEVVQVSDGSRTFFYVGDVKQAIYAWRGGDPGLFDRVYHRYAGNPYLAKSPLNVSWRSAPAIIDAVNQVFDHLAKVPGLSNSLVSRWNKNWGHHQVASKNQALSGFCGLLQLPRVKGESAEDRLSEKAEAVANIIKALPADGSCSIAILVRSNKTGQEIAHQLRTAHRLDVSLEGQMSLADNTLVAALLSLIKIAEYPDDELAWQHVGMTPFLGNLINNQPRVQMHNNLLGTLHEQGYAALLQSWFTRMGDVGWMPDAFHASRFDELLAAAHDFDQSPGGRVTDFIEFVVHRTVSERSPGSYIRILTIHAAKGLEFDAVILPDLQNAGFSARALEGLTLHEGPPPDQQPEWALIYPPKPWADADPVLRSHRNSAEEDQSYEELCALYVAMTRAKRALYMIAHEDAEKSDVLYASTLITHLLSPGTTENASWIYKHGTENWHATSRLKPGQQTERSMGLDVCCPGFSQPLGPDVATHHPPRTRLVRQLPSQEEIRTIQAAQLFHTGRRDSLQTGTLVHNLLSQITWLDEISEEQGSMLTQYIPWGCGTQGLFTRPAGAVELWREKPFEIVLDGKWISGRFDRVVIERKPSGEIQHVTLIDFKTDRLASPDDFQARAAAYRPQLNLYRDALARMLNWPATSIHATLAFLHAQEASVAGHDSGDS